ncbi:MAG: sugar phosphate isomerase/epimerase [Verrucomicrobiia bacterium]
MKISNVAVQLYTLRDFCQTPSDLAASLKKLREIGYEAIQVSGIGPISYEEVRTIASGEGLTICATHESSEMILDQPELVVDRLKTLGCLHTAYPYPAGVDFSQADAVKRLAEKLDRSGAILAESGLILSYHNHHHEFLKVNGTTILEQLYASTQPSHLAAELDTYWVQYGGGNPVEWCKKMAGRMRCLHIKDYAINREAKVVFAEIGHGNLDFHAIIAAAEDGGCEWFIVEQDSCPGDPFDSLAASFEYISNSLVS